MSLPNQSDQGGGIGAQIARGSITLVIMRWSTRLLGLLSTLVLARLLVPEDFGLVAIATAYFGIIEGVIALNIDAALIRFRERDRDLYGTAWTLAVIRGVILSVLMIATAGPIASLMDDTRLFWVILAFSAQPLIHGLTNPYFIDFEKELSYRQLFFVNVTSKVLSTASGVTVAILYQSYWALVVGIMIGSVARLVMSYVMRPRLPRFCLRETSRILEFSIWLSGNSILMQLNLNLFNFVIGRSIGPVGTGQFHIATQLAGFIKEFTTGPISYVMFSAFAKLSDDVGAMREAYVKVTAIILLIGFPACFGLALVSEDFVALVLGNKWLEMAPYLAILSILVAIESLVSVSDQVAMALGNTRAIFNRKLIQAVATILGLVVAYHFDSVMAYVLVRFCSGVLYTLLSQTLARQMLGAGLGREVFRRSLRPIVGTIFMIAAVGLFAPFLPSGADTLSVGIRLAINAFAGASAYILSVLVMWHMAGKPPGAERQIFHVASKLMGGKLASASDESRNR